ncbi:hypothetical protein GCM10011581_00170 [Saccharopolyspora subtropica]|uniref:Putative Flp pilus-assembly TadG-like N-terminal domain-containing protein n=1 Tax=Saccharopolyspora thermophila TaxID=89367 RepID=A0A917JKD8_9PSEU|nr:Rv3654c family TadE-like protein [Saccharopolyspora subtropica]GGI67338.1 hypothetical protein GCM10011581_00170 [Saccharopolyspora subtropica]
MNAGTPRDRGAATALSAVVSLAVIALLWVGLQLGAVITARHRAEGAADLAALAAAAHAPYGEQIACDRANLVAQGMETHITQCRLDGWEARVTVRADLPEIALSGRNASARARAGPTGD